MIDLGPLGAQVDVPEAWREGTRSGRLYWTQ